MTDDGDAACEEATRLMDDLSIPGMGRCDGPLTLPYVVGA